MSAFASVRSRTAKRYSSEHSVELSLSLSLAHTFSHDLVLSHRSARTSKKKTSCGFAMCMIVEETESDSKTSRNYRTQKMKLT